MNISQKCNCCMHEEICSKKEQYQSACHRIKTAIDYSEKDLLSVSVKCNHFASVSQTRKGGAE